ncbi:OLC1v1021840C1 [Oldenlandia corymbosa var. corymbosa]|uniref:OLC1v1021840C1 n=1 Tax=Oldenlandia corymbosa var. corymbosa TaxID=529605 RepID=A0AAV1BY64_OLDCO|nr:OLC1v1021840C1 [Oldenlandia corymbosa var. corymbosa]
MSSLVRLFRRASSTLTANPTSNINSTKAVVKSLYDERNLKKLVEKFKQHSHSDRFRMQIGIYRNTVRRLASAKRFNWIEDILEYQKQFTHDLSKEGFAVRLISLYGDSRMFDNAQKVFDEMPELNCERTVLSVNALLGACVSSRKFDKVEGLFRELTEKLNVKPDVFTYNTVIKAVSELGSPEKYISLMDEMEENGIKPDTITFNPILMACYANGKFDDGEKLWSRMVAKNVVPDIRSYNARLLGLANEGRMNEAVECFNDLGSKKLKADVFSFGAIIRGYYLEDNLEEVKTWYRKVIENNFAPDKGIFSYAVSLACKKGDYDWGFEICQEIFKRKCSVDEQLLQNVVDGLVKESRIDDAKQMAEMGKSNNYRQYDLRLPS